MLNTYRVSNVTCLGDPAADVEPVERDRLPPQLRRLLPRTKRPGRTRTRTPPIGSYLYCAFFDFGDFSILKIMIKRTNISYQILYEI